MGGLCAHDRAAGVDHGRYGTARPRPPDADRFCFDESRLAQVLSNLIGNAIQYGHANEPVSVRLAGNGDDVVVAINNRGATIAPDHIKTIFDPMVRIAANAGIADSGYMERTSLGIGLYISREIIHAHDGKVEVESNAADGTTFTLTMPRLPAGFR